MGTRPRAFFLSFLSFNSFCFAFFKLLYRYTILCSKIHTLFFYVTRTTARRKALVIKKVFFYNERGNLR